ncbi:MAG: hypothetical protein ACXAC7_10345 [Candidatus Hodarchaeales archaeon]
MINETWLTSLDNFQTHYSELIEQYEKKNPKVLQFWQDSYNHYIKKIKIPVFPAIKNPRRNFHLSAVNYLLKKIQPEIIWNLCVGNIRTLLPIIELYIEESALERAIVWINIDLLSELQDFNTEILENRWKTLRIKRGSLSAIIHHKRMTVLNLRGTVENFAQLFNQHDMIALSSQQLLICVDGFPNVIKDPSTYLKWWNNFREILSSSFQGWYFTWLNAQSLEAKFEFYYHVAHKKHAHPLYWVEATPMKIKNTPSKSSNLTITRFEDNKICTNNTLKFPLTATSYQIIQNKMIDKTVGWIFRFFTSSDLSELVYQATYIIPSILDIFTEIVSSLHPLPIQLVNYNDIDALLFINETKIQTRGQEGFVKTLPVLAFQE